MPMIDKFDILINIADTQPGYLSEIALFALKCL